MCSPRCSKVSRSPPTTASRCRSSGTAAATKASRRSGCKGYTRALRESLAEMNRQVGPDNVIVRHLVLPSGVASPEKVMPLIAGVSKDLWVNVLSQYRPVYRAARFPVIGRGVDRQEV